MQMEGDDLEFMVSQALIIKFPISDSDSDGFLLWLILD